MLVFPFENSKTIFSSKDTIEMLLSLENQPTLPGRERQSKQSQQ